jgi:MYXO-CTERM domain-containing protein
MRSERNISEPNEERGNAMRRSIAILAMCVLLAVAGTAHAHKSDFLMPRPSGFIAPNVTADVTTFLQQWSGEATGFVAGTWQFVNNEGLVVTSNASGGGVPDVAGYGWASGQFALGELQGNYTMVITPDEEALGRVWGTNTRTGLSFEGAMTVQVDGNENTLTGEISFVEYNGEQIYEELVFLTNGSMSSELHTDHSDTSLRIDVAQATTATASGYAGSPATFTAGPTPGLTSVWANAETKGGGGAVAEYGVEAGDGATWGEMVVTDSHLSDAELFLVQDDFGNPGSTGSGMMDFDDSDYAPEATVVGAYPTGQTDPVDEEIEVLGDNPFVGGDPSIFEGVLKHQVLAPVPEPAGLGLIGLGLLALRRRRS